MDSNPIQPLAFTPVVVELHKMYQQATGGPTSLEVTSEERAHSQFSSRMSASIYIVPIYSASTIIYSESASGHDALADFTAEVLTHMFLEKKTNMLVNGWKLSSLNLPHEREQAISDDSKKEIKLEDLSKLVQNVEIDFMDLDSPEDDQSIIVEDEEKEEQPELSKLLSSQDFSSSLPTELKELPSKFNELTREVKELKKHVHDLKIELPGI
ncbi:hypothetical protein Tco_1512221 [Tanacetum coccineum]